MLNKIISLIKKSFAYRVYLKAVKKYNIFTIDKIYPLIYNLYARYPVNENKVLFIEYTHPHMTESFICLYNALKNGYRYDTECVFCMHNTGSRRQQRKRMRRIIKKAAAAKYIFFNEGNDRFSRIAFRPETEVTQLWHGCGAFKRFGLSCADLKFGATREYMQTHPFYNGYKTVTVSSAEVMWAYEQAMGYTRESGVVKPLGISRTDDFYDEKYISDSYEMLYKAVPQAKGKKVLLYAPTFRGHVNSACAPDFLDIRRLHEKLSGEWVLIIKQHPHVKKRPQVPEECAAFAFDVSDSMQINNLLCAADVCISDYSSLVFEYSLLQRPMIFLAPDLEEYFDWRGFYYDYYDMTPGPVVKTTDEIIDFIKSLPGSFDMNRVINFRNRFMSACDGHSTERIIREVFDNPEKHRK
ncbi:MAG: CDP-glycerol glycerophosphotransferase family protein [Clostridia bacterium]|nr:CDP-glycerol glycerophosphotransferase family protein [Clostridia bacterium]